MNVSVSVSVDGVVLKRVDADAALAEVGALIEQGIGLPRIVLTPCGDDPVVIEDPPVILEPVEPFSWSGPASVSHAEVRVVEAAAVRATSDAAHLERELGIVSAPPVFAAGSQLIASGRARLVASHAEWSALPPVKDALAQLGARICSEHRSDVLMDGTETMDADGRIAHAVFGPLAIEEGQVEDVARAGGLPAGSGRLFALMSPEDRAHTWNRYGKDTCRWVARTRQGPSGNAIFAAVSPHYTAFDADEIADALYDVVNPMARAEVMYDPAEARITIDGYWHASAVEDFGAGDYFRLGFRVSSSDNGTGSVRIAPVAVRNLCLNLLIIDEREGPALRLVHRGDADAIRDRLATALHRIQAAYTPFLRRWKYIDDLPINQVLLGWDGVDPRVAREAWGRAAAGVALPRGEGDAADRLRSKWPSVPAPAAWGAPRAEVASEITASFDDEPSDFVSALVNSVTRLHRRPVPVPVVQTGEALGGQLVSMWGAR